LLKQTGEAKLLSCFLASRRPEPLGSRLFIAKRLRPGSYDPRIAYFVGDQNYRQLFEEQQG